jgi:hypothetical protein
VLTRSFERITRNSEAEFLDVNALARNAFILTRHQYPQKQVGTEICEISRVGTRHVVTTCTHGGGCHRSNSGSNIKTPLPDHIAQQCATGSRVQHWTIFTRKRVNGTLAQRHRAYRSNTANRLGQNPLLKARPSLKPLVRKKSTRGMEMPRAERASQQQRRETPASCARSALLGVLLLV